MLAVLIWTKVDFDRSKAFFLGRRGPNSTTDRVALLFWWFLSQIHPLARAEASQAVPRVAGQCLGLIARPSPETRTMSGTASDIFYIFRKNCGTWFRGVWAFPRLAGHNVWDPVPGLAQRPDQCLGTPQIFFIYLKKIVELGFGVSGPFPDSPGNVWDCSARPGPETRTEGKSEG